MNVSLVNISKNRYAGSSVGNSVNLLFN